MTLNEIAHLLITCYSAVICIGCINCILYPNKLLLNGNPWGLRKRPVKRDSQKLSLGVVGFQFTFTSTSGSTNSNT